MSVENNLLIANQTTYLEFIKTGNSTITFSSGTTNVTTINHNLGYVPIVLAYLYDGEKYIPFPVTVSLGWDTTNNILRFKGYADFYVDKNNLYLRGMYINFSGTIAYPIKYYLFREKAN